MKISLEYTRPRLARNFAVLIWKSRQSDVITELSGEVFTFLKLASLVQLQANNICLPTSVVRQKVHLMVLL